MKWNNTINTEVWGGDGSKIAVVNNKANARLIAAAPELLETCKLALCGLNGMTTENFRLGRDRKIRERLQAAIDKAEGKEESA